MLQIKPTGGGPSRRRQPNGQVHSKTRSHGQIFDESRRVTDAVIDVAAFLLADGLFAISRG
jgi:hypothetical protein